MLSKLLWKSRQRALNRFFKNNLLGYAPLIVDGHPGSLTRRYIRHAKWFLGYQTHRDAGWSKRFRDRLKNPHSGRFSNDVMLHRGTVRRHDHNEWFRKTHQVPVAPHGLAHFDGLLVAAYFVPILTWARAHGWNGRVVSGFRDPAYSESLCFRMCGAPSCPGRCAGRASHHSGTEPPSGAVDVSDYVNFGNIVARCPVAPKIFNRLPSDRVHFGPLGN